MKTASAFMTEAVKRGWATENPLATAKPSRIKRTSKRHYTDDELARVFGDESFAALSYHRKRRGDEPHPERWWLPLLALHTGARTDELCGLRTQDVERRRDGLWLSITEHEARSVKTDAANRAVPVPRSLAEAGFAAYVQRVHEEGHASLWPTLKNADASVYGKYFRRLQERARVTEDLDFHSFRRTFLDRMDLLDDPPELHVRKALVGHEDSDITTGTYAGGAKTIPAKRPRSTSEAVAGCFQFVLAELPEVEL